MASMTLPEILEHCAKQEQVRIIPKTKKPIDIFVFQRHMKSLAKRFGVSTAHNGVGLSANYELASEEGGDPSTDNKYCTYWATFEDEPSAKKFVGRVNRDSTLMYRAKAPTSPC